MIKKKLHNLEFYDRCSLLAHLKIDYVILREVIFLLLLYNNFILELIVLMSRVFANGPGDQGSIQVRVIPKTKKMVLDAALLNTAL